MATSESEEKQISWAEFLVICDQNDLFSKCQYEENPRQAVTEKVNTETICQKRTRRYKNCG